MRAGKNFRSWLGQNRFLKDLKHIRRIPEIVNFEEASKIGLLYDATDDRNSEVVKSYVKSVRANYRKDILAIGYVDKKRLAPSQFAQFGLDYFTRKDLNFHMIPVTAVVNN